MIVVFVCLMEKKLLVLLRRVLVLEITKTKTPKFTVKFDLKLGGKDQT